MIDRVSGFGDAPAQAAVPGGGSDDEASHAGGFAVGGRTSPLNEGAERHDCARRRLQSRPSA